MFSDVTINENIEEDIGMLARRRLFHSKSVLFDKNMKAEEFNNAFITYIGQRESAFYWVEVPKTVIWHNSSSNKLCSDLGIDISCEDYDSVWDCVNDLCDSVADYYNKQGIIVHETVAVASYDNTAHN